MARERKLLPGIDRWRDPRISNRVFSYLGHILILLLALFFSHFIVQRLGTPMLMVCLVMLVFGSVYAYFSFRSLFLPFIVWVLAIGGFRFLWSLNVPVLPDLYIDRLAMIWLGLVFTIKFVVNRRVLRGPFLLDSLILANGLYILVRVYLDGNIYFHTWTMSFLIPYSAYFLAKNIITKTKMVRQFLWVLLILLVYYEVISIAEKFDINWLIWPKRIISEGSHWKGRSGGPYLHAPLFGTVIGMLLPIHLYFLATVRSTSKRTLLLVSFLLCFAGLYFTYTRGAWLAGVAALGTTVFLNRRHYLRMVMPALIVVPLLGIFFLGIGQDTFMKERVGNEHTISSRLGTAVTALRMWKANPLLGVGFFQFRHLQKEYVQPVDIPLMGSVKYSEMLLVPIHDIYLGPLAEDGLVGALLQGSIYLFILLAFLKKYKKREKNDHFATYILPIFGGLWIGYLVGGLAIDYRFFSIVGALFYMFAGITVGLDSDEDQGMEEFEDEVRGSGRQME